MQVAYFRGNRVGTRLSDSEFKKLQEIMNEYGQTNLSETIRFLINANHNSQVLQGSLMREIKN